MILLHKKFNLIEILEIFDTVGPCEFISNSCNCELLLDWASRAPSMSNL
jgi:hypothetical protein